MNLQRLMRNLGQNDAYTVFITAGFKCPDFSA